MPMNSTDVTYQFFLPSGAGYMMRRLKPTPTAKEAQFSTADPWNRGEAAQFTLLRCTLSDGWGWQGAHTFALRSALDGRLRHLPPWLATLQRQGRLPLEALPDLLFDVENSLCRKDYRLFVPQRSRRSTWIAVIVLGLLAMLAFLVGLVNRPDPAHAPVKLSAEQWWNQALETGRYIVVLDQLVPAGVNLLEQAIHMPQGMDVGPRTGHRIAWLATAREKRLILIPPYYFDGANLRSLSLSGLVLEPHALGIDAALLQGLSGQIPDLNIQQVLCLSCIWHDTYGGRQFSKMAFFFAWSAGLAGVLVWLGYLRRSRYLAWRQRGALARLDSAPG